MLENEEDFAEDIAKAIEEAHLFSCYFGTLGLFFFLIFWQGLFLWARTNKLFLFFLLSLALFPIVREHDEVTK